MYQSRNCIHIMLRSLVSFVCATMIYYIWNPLWLGKIKFTLRQHIRWPFKFYSYGLKNCSSFSKYIHIVISLQTQYARVCMTQVVLNLELLWCWYDRIARFQFSRLNFRKYNGVGRGKKLCDILGAYINGRNCGIQGERKKIYNEYALVNICEGNGRKWKYIMQAIWMTLEDNESTIRIENGERKWKFRWYM